MLKILKNLKKYWVSVISIILLLCVQAYVDLELPNYTSKIVNIGIQSGGIERSIPEIISKNDFNYILLFSKNDEEILENYKLLKDNNFSRYEKDILKKYFGNKYKEEIQGKEIYILKQDVNEKELEKLLLNPLMELTAIKEEETSRIIKEQLLENVQEEQKQYIIEKELIDIISSMPEEQRNQLLIEFTKKIEEMPDLIKGQASVVYVKQIYENAGINTTKLQNNYILLSGLQMIGITAISMIAAVLVMLLSSKVAAKLGVMLRDKVFRKVLSFSNKELSEFSTASLITRNTNDISQIQQLMTMLFRVVVYAPIIGIGGVIRVMTTTNSGMAWVIGVAIMAIICIVGVLFVVAMPRFKKLQELTDKLNLVSREILTGLPVIRAFNKEKTEEVRFNRANKDLMKVNIFVNRAMSMMMPLIMLIMNTITILIIWVGGHNIDKGLMQVGDMIAFMQYTMQIIISFLMISMISIMLPRAGVSAKRINEVLDTQVDIKDKEKTKKLDKTKKGLVEFKNVSFRYPDADTEILSDINITAKPGETTAIIGSTGSGKSTVVNLLPRFYDVTGGELLIDGVNVKEVSQKSLREVIGFVPQKGILFSGTIESNIKYSNSNMSDDKMIEAAKIAQATEFIESKKKKYKEEIAQGGNNVSGGQRQRLSIARAIAKEPEIFVFDDSFSALDFKTDSKLREALASKTKDKTVIIVAQRVSTIMNAEKIVVLEEGKVVGTGTHEELFKNNETYRQIALSQLSEKELGEKGGK